MATETAYGPYTISTLPVGNGVHIGELQSAIEASGSGISIQVKGISKSGDTFTITMKDVLPSAEKNTLDGSTAQAANDPPAAGSIVGDHDGTPPPVDPKLREDGILYAVPKEGTHGWQMCDRDFRIETSIFDGPSSLEDLHVAPATRLEGDWGELVLEGVYKDDGGSMVACTSQADADASCILSVWDYAARNPQDSNNLLAYEMRDGGLVVDPNLPAAERWDHRTYAVGGPDIPASMGGGVRFFDGYLGPALDAYGQIHAKSAQATMLDPAAGAGASVLRIYVFHPAGSKLKHVLRLVTFRPPVTFP